MIGQAWVWPCIDPFLAFGVPPSDPPTLLVSPSGSLSKPSKVQLFVRPFDPSTRRPFTLRILPYPTPHVTPRPTSQTGKLPAQFAQSGSIGAVLGRQHDTPDHDRGRNFGDGQKLWAGQAKIQTPASVPTPQSQSKTERRSDSSKLDHHYVRPISQNMTGAFSSIDTRRCRHYARFFQNLSLKEANAIFWLLFSFVSTTTYRVASRPIRDPDIRAAVQEPTADDAIALTERDKLLPKEVVESQEHKIKNRRTRIKCLMWASLCLALSASATVLECFAAFNIQYCDGEDLMQLYWGFWSVLQVGSNIAILGVMVQFWIVLGDVETPSWAVALGTPILVFAALGFVFRAIWIDFLQKLGRKRKQAAPDEERGESRDGDDSDGEEDEKQVVTSHTLSIPDPSSPTVVNDTTEDVISARPAATQPRPAPTPRGTTVWSRDLQYLLGSVVHDRSEDHPVVSQELHIYHHRDASGRSRSHGGGRIGSRVQIVTPNPRSSQ
ncbi:hypothetical protein MBM_06713 [Drepanopeziza brunnea f. sp. 'multigermtubi' MB_m1]|uniref:Uncharacterized protein n=1 Tax=Marssonina brunnea f. sp. multigermtubi (strain MB_m1) TaxID=1072389 RepID=K1WRB6_MARBU|nr:uncharacterized protein MBM_06713 [Drepanopeziza brunnea f. sp. 'multigermtubi' MB_m1]EKD14952.1 hypothetical protein MBM_06713 [Drepanopeziza brunnea f. sp. 'multigermtubi' MB_m1]